MFGVAISVVLMVIGTSSGQKKLDPNALPSEWTPEQFPNPMRNPEVCGLNNVKSGYVCDPDRLLTTKQRETLNWWMEGLMKNDTPCPCSAWACEQKKQGYSVGIAIMRKMKIPDRSMKPLDQAQVFAHYLQTSHWHYGRCEEGIVILYSQDDQALQFLAGTTARRLLTNDVARGIGHLVKYNFQRDDPAHGFYEITLLLREVLSGNHLHALAPNVQALHGGASFITVAISSLIMTLSALFIVS